MNIKHIFFDLDQTLWDFDKNSALAFQSCFDTMKIGVDFDVFLKIYEPINETLWKLYGEGKITKDELKYARLKDTFDALSYQISDENINQLSESYLHILPTFNHLHPGTIDVLDFLHPNYTLHIITNGFNEVSFRKVEQSGLGKYFSQIITSENAGAKKPDPRVFHYALSQAQAQIHDSIMIGDNYEADILGAKGVGMQTIYYNCNNKPEVTDVVTITKLTELKSVF